VVIFGGAARVFAALPAQIGLPVHGWTVCADLGVGPVPGLPASVQRLRLCQGSGWEVQAYCLNPQQPAPALGSACSMLNDTDFWCGDSVQQLRNYQLLQTPAPSSTPLPSSTPSPLPSPTATVTPLPSLTPTLPLPSETVEVTPPSGGFDTPGPGPSPTLFERPYPGGEGLRAPLFSALSLLAGFGLLGAAFWLARRG
jgi:hypothetical protein